MTELQKEKKREYNRKYREKQLKENPEEFRKKNREYNRRYREKQLKENPEEFRKKEREYTKNYIKTWRSNNKKRYNQILYTYNSKFPTPNNGKRYTKYEIELILNSTNSVATLAHVLGRSVNSICNKRYSLNKNNK